MDFQSNRSWCDGWTPENIRSGVAAGSSEGLEAGDRDYGIGSSVEG